MYRSRFWWTLGVVSALVALGSGAQVYRYPNSTAPQKADDESPHRIVGGRPIAILEAPWQIALLEKGQFVCGGSVISRRWVLTAAHCVYGYPGPYTVRAGSRRYSRGGQLRRAQRIFVHKHYNARTTQNDIALIRVRKPFNFNARVKRVKLASRRDRLPKRYFVSGWGLTGEHQPDVSRGLYGVVVKKVRRKKCVRRYRKAHINVPYKAICAASRGKDSCSGDSGGPLVWKGVQFGVVSFGIGCARRFYPGVYTDVRDYNRFIKSVTKRYSRSPALTYSRLFVNPE